MRSGSQAERAAEELPRITESIDFLHELLMISQEIVTSVETGVQRIYDYREGLDSGFRPVPCWCRAFAGMTGKWFSEFLRVCHIYGLHGLFVCGTFRARVVIRVGGPRKAAQIIILVECFC
jgi:hypothetical protein